MLQRIVLWQALSRLDNGVTYWLSMLCWTLSTMTDYYNEYVTGADSTHIRVQMCLYRLRQNSQSVGNFDRANIQPLFISLYSQLRELCEKSYSKFKLFRPFLYRYRWLLGLNTQTAHVITYNSVQQRVVIINFPNLKGEFSVTKLQWFWSGTHYYLSTQPLTEMSTKNVSWG